MQTFENLPLYWAVVDDDAQTGLSYISLVDRPAIQRDFVAMGAAKNVALCAVANEEKRLVYGAILRANFPVYRQDSQRGEYYLAFSPESIRATVEKFFADKQVGNVNLMHEPDSQVEGVNLVQLFIKNTAAGISPAGFEEIEDGSLFGEYHVANQEIWDAIKAGEYRGFSIEGTFSYVTQQQHFKPKNTAMSKLEKFKARLAKLLVQFGAATTDKGAIFWDGDEDLKAGIAVYIEDENGERQPAPDGDYKTDDDKTIKVVDGKVAEISDPKAEVAAKGQGEGGEGGAAGTPAPEPAKTSDPDGKDGDLETLRKELEEAKRHQEESDKRLSDIEASLEKVLAALDKANIELRAIKKQPAGRDAHVEFNSGAPVGKTGDAKLDRLSKLLHQ